MNLLVHLPAECKDQVYQEYQEWGWEHKFMSEDLMRQGWWVPAHKLKAGDAWSHVYIVNATVLKQLLKDLARWWKEMAPGHVTSVNHIQASKPMKQTNPACEGMTIAQWKLHCCCVFCNWVVPECVKCFGNDSLAVLETWWGGKVLPLCPLGFCSQS